MTRLTPGDETFRSLAAPPTVPVTMIARITSIWRSVSMSGRPLFAPSRRIPGQIFSRELVEVILPIGAMIASEVEQIIPVEDPGRMKIVEHEPDRVQSDLQHLDNLDITLSGHCLPILGRMSLHFGAWAFHAQIFGRQIELLTSIECNRQGFAILVQAQFRRPNLRVGHQFTNRTMPVTLRS